MRTLVGILDYVMSTGPIVYGIYLHDWLLVGGVIIGELSIAFTFALKKDKDI